MPCFLLMLASGAPGMVLGAAGLLCFFIGVFPPAALTSLLESLPVARRAGAIGVIYALAVALFGGTAQYIVTWLIDVTHTPLAPAWYMTGAVLLSMIAMAAMRETAPVRAND